VIAVRAEGDADHARVHEIHAAAFGRLDEAELVEALRRLAHPRLSLVAEREGRVVGHVFFSPVALEGTAGGPAAAGLAPVAVDPAHQGSGVGSALVRAGLRRCPERGWRAVFLVGDPDYYARFGFALAAPAGFTYGDPHLDPALQVLELERGALAGHRGRVRFHPAFAGSPTAQPED